MIKNEMRGQYVYKTVEPDGGGKEHIVRVENNEWGWVTTVCGHETFEPPFKTYSSVEDLSPDVVCKNCLMGVGAYMRANGKKD